jgi:hypothetical protein
MGGSRIKTRAQVVSPSPLNSNWNAYIEASMVPVLNIVHMALVRSQIQVMGNCGLYPVVAF